MSELPSYKDGGRSEFITEVDYDLTEYSQHKKYVVEIRGYLTQADYARLRHPQSRDDYHELAMLVISRYPFLRRMKTMDHYSALVKREYIGDDVAEPVWDEFKRKVDICLEHGRFRDIRVLGAFYPNVIFMKDFIRKLWWEKLPDINSLRIMMWTGRWIQAIGWGHYNK